MPATLTRGTNSSSFVYGPEHQRVEQAASSSSGTVTTYYVTSGFEQVTNSATGVTENHYYLGAYGRRIAMLVDSSNGTTSWRYFHQDHLSSIEAVTDQNGALVERLSYDSWGNRRNLDGTDSATPIVAIDKRGYTDQEELDNLEVVHMNGRIYAPLLGRFISADPIISASSDPQTHNRYSYVSNRPLSFLDPSGHLDIAADSDVAVTTTYGDGSVSTFFGTGADLGSLGLDGAMGTLDGSGAFTVLFNQDPGTAPGNGAVNSVAPDASGTTAAPGGTTQPQDTSPGSPEQVVVTGSSPRLAPYDVRPDSPQLETIVVTGVTAKHLQQRLQEVEKLVKQVVCGTAPTNPGKEALDTAHEAGAAAEFATPLVETGAAIAGASRGAYAQAQLVLGTQLAEGLQKLGRIGGYATGAAIGVDLLGGDYASAAFHGVDYFVYSGLASLGAAGALESGGLSVAGAALIMSKYYGAGGSKGLAQSAMCGSQ